MFVIEYDISINVVMVNILASIIIFEVVNNNNNRLSEISQVGSAKDKMYTDLNSTS